MHHQIFVVIKFCLVLFTLQQRILTGTSKFFVISKMQSFGNLNRNFLVASATTENNTHKNITGDTFHHWKCITADTRGSQRVNCK